MDRTYFIRRGLKTCFSDFFSVQQYRFNILRSFTKNALERRIFSGIQPTGIPHIGNYLGTLKKWVELQNTAELSTILLFCIADLHAITIPKNPIELKKHKREMFVALEAIGIDTKRSIVYEQSTVPYHSELAWILNCVIPVSHLQRMTQWKTKSSQFKNTTSTPNLGLFAYPVLQAADILLYKATDVPVGEDQIQHLELTSTISRFFNRTFSKNIFTSPNILLTPSKRIMSLRNPKQKMSKSDPNPNSRILITDSFDIIESKILHAITDSYDGITYDPDKRPGIANLLQILASLDYPSSDPIKIAKDNSNLSHKAFKSLVTKSIYTFFTPIRERYQCIMSQNISSYIEQNKKGTCNAQKLASHTMEQVKTCIGLL
ncbi:tryptophan-tRNA ligase [Pneumocystis jirovecii RU7]|uniref:Tryptophan--tRNA ligase, mitochondrial n=1 Tax=Pneumocystis jirovecii (strain RU7) TaxID=1408657 RepID=A0A0W4ZHJ3_PNEJ7|nr:tryptophan-tRNA ligase [Pneumocystis jirovecii RU7]KTW27832.1 tryptophan-tRNA ligase [Pneumocystis jirovecii RU7]